MEKDMKDLLIDYIDGNLSAELHEYVKKQMEADNEIKELHKSLKETMGILEQNRPLDPDPGLKENFLKALEDEMQMPGRTIDSWRVLPWQIAAAISLLACGVLLGILFTRDNGDQHHIADLKNEVAVTKHLILQTLEDKQSASKRLNAIYTSNQVSNMDDDIIEALIRTMNQDDNTNVRLAAVEALEQFADDTRVRKALIVSLEQQSDPLVQIALINLMVQLKERDAIRELNKIIDNKETIESVKNEAFMAVFKLS